MNLVSIPPWNRILWILVALFAGCWGLVFVWGTRGFDLSDNGFYLLAASQPQNITVDVWWFAGMIHYLYKWGGETVVGLRLAGITIMLVITFGFSYVSVRVLLPHVIGSQRWALIISGGIAGTLYYHNWLTTPSYNWLTLAGVLVAVTGVLAWFNADRRPCATLGGILLGVGTALIAWGKLTSFALFFALLPLAPYVMSYRAHRWERLRWPWWILPLVGAALVALLGLAQEVSIENWIAKLQRGFEYQRLLRASDALVLVRFVQQPLLSLNILMILVIGVLLPVWGSAALLRLRARYHASAFEKNAGLICLAGLLWLTVLLGNARGMGAWAYALWLLILSLYVVDQRRVQRTTSGDAVSGRSRVAGSLFFASLPIVISYGTGDYVMHTGMSAFLLMMSAFLLIGRLSSERLQRVLLFSLALASLGILLNTARAPYRQTVPLWNLETSASLKFGREDVQTDEGLAAYLDNLQQAAVANGFSVSTPVIDLTGHAPGAVYALDGAAYGFLWLLGGYPGSDAAARFALSAWPQDELARGWILTSDGDRAITSVILADLGLRFPDRYVAVGSFYLSHMGETHTLWKPADVGCLGGLQ